MMHTLTPESGNVEFTLSSQDIRCIINEFLKYRRNIKLGAKFLNYLAYATNRSPPEMYQEIFDKEPPASMHQYLREVRRW